MQQCWLSNGRREMDGLYVAQYVAICESFGFSRLFQLGNIPETTTTGWLAGWLAG